MGRSQNYKSSSTTNCTKVDCLRSTTRPIMKTSPTANARPPGTQGGSKAQPGNGKTKNVTDRSQLNFPYDVRLSGFASLQKAVTNGTPRVQRILMEECDYIVECRVCRNLFRSIPNFITHKLNYCKKSFDSTWCVGLSNLIQTSDTRYNIEYEVDPALLLDDDPCTDSNSRSVTDFYSEIAEKAQKCSTTHSDSDDPSSTPSDDSCIRLQLKPLLETAEGMIALQQRITTDPSNCDINSAHANLVETAPRDTAVLGPDGKVMCTGTAKGIEAIVSKLTAKLNSQNQNSFPCKACKAVFNSEKALCQHEHSCPHYVNGKPVESRVPVNSYSSASTASFKSSRSPIQSPLKLKRNLPLSPVKKIKLKYMKFDSCNSDDSKNEKKVLTCKRCSTSFCTHHEMSMHLAMCNGVINYAFLRDNRPQEEKIRISARNDFSKPPEKLLNGPSLTANNDGNNVSVVSRKSKLSQGKPMKKKKKSLTQQPSILSKSNGTSEVNNNKQYKNENPPPSTVTTTEPTNSNILDLNGTEGVLNCDVSQPGVKILNNNHSNNELKRVADETKRVKRIVSAGALSSAVVKKRASLKLQKNPKTIRLREAKHKTNANDKNSETINGSVSTSLKDGCFKPKLKPFNLRSSVKPRTRKSSRAVYSRTRQFELRRTES